MFKVLKEKLNIFKKRISDEVIGEQAATFIGKKINEKTLDKILDEFEISLLEADVAYDVAEEIRSRVRENIINTKVRIGADPGDVVEQAFRKAMLEILSYSNFDIIKDIEKSEKPYVMMFLGINGTGKTTTIAKVARLLQRRGYIPVIAAADTFRAGAIEQLEYHASRLNVTLIKHQQGSDPASVAYDAIAHAKARGKHVVLIDTAGRMQTNRNLMEEMKKIKRVARPNHTVFVGDALAGNDIINQAKTFDENVGFDSIILCKVDADAKGGAAISLSYELKKPIIFLGTGQGYDDIIEFDPNFIMDRIFSNNVA